MGIKRYKIIQDLVYEITGDDELILTNERFDGAKIFTPRGVKVYYIDDKGIKHIKQYDESWQPLECDFNDELVFDSTTNTWRVKTEQEKLQDLKQQKIKELKQFAYNYITSNYPLWKQNNDLSDAQQIATELVSLFHNVLTTDDIRYAIYQVLSGQKSVNDIMIEYGLKAGLLKRDPNDPSKVILDSNIDESYISHIMELANKLLEISKRILWKNKIRENVNKVEKQIEEMNNLDELRALRIDETLIDPDTRA
jgi:hypothetical protein